MSMTPPVEPATLPDGWLRLFDGERLGERAGDSAVLATIDEEGWPHLSFLSVGEVLAPGLTRLYFATWSGSRSTGNLRRTGQASLFAAVDGAVWESRLRVRLLEGETGPLAVSAADVIAVRKHAAPYATALGMVSFSLDDPAGAIGRWEKQMALLRRLAGADSG
jgi:hypothetical protein